MKKQTKNQWIAVIGLAVAIAAAVLIAIYVSDNKNIELNYGNTLTHPSQQAATQ